MRVCLSFPRVLPPPQPPDISGYSYVTHNGAYISFIIYLYGSGRGDDYILMFYYLMGFSQNILVVLMKVYYERRAARLEREASEGGAGRGAARTPAGLASVVPEPNESSDERVHLWPEGDGDRLLDEGEKRGIAGESNREMNDYHMRRRWYKKYNADKGTEPAPPSATGRW